MKKQIIIYLGVIVVLIGLIAGGFYLYQSGVIFHKAAPTTVTAKICPATNDGKTIIYQGKEGVTALDLLNQQCDAISSGSGDSAFITDINGVTANSTNEFWSYKVNNELASVGAGSYTTKDSDTITWELSSF